MKRNILFAISSLLIFLFSCASIKTSKEETDVSPVKNNVVKLNKFTTNKKRTYKILFLGDSYTVGTSVCKSCKFPEQLADTLVNITSYKNAFPLKIIATTGWTTTNLINAINSKNLATDYNLVTLLIGVNNQFQRKSFAVYKTEFPELIEMAIKAANNNPKKIIVLSIPDYAFTPFGKANKTISKEIDTYNNFAKNYCKKNKITFINITDITRQGLNNASLIAKDGLHPSKIAYKKFVERILPLAKEKLNIN